MQRQGWRRAAAGLTAVWLALVSPARGQTTDDHATAQALIGQIEGDAHAALAADALGQAKTALERATRMRATSDETHARAADQLALEWAQTARDLLKAVEGETAAAEVRKKAVDAQAQLERNRVAVEEGIARVGRLKAELAEAEARGRDRTAVEKHDVERGTTRAADDPRKRPGAKAPDKKVPPNGDAP